MRVDLQKSNVISTFPTGSHTEVFIPRFFTLLLLISFSCADPDYSDELNIATKIVSDSLADMSSSTATQLLKFSCDVHIKRDSILLDFTLTNTGDQDVEILHGMDIVRVISVSYDESGELQRKSYPAGAIPDVGYIQKLQPDSHFVRSKNLLHHFEFEKLVNQRIICFANFALKYDDRYLEYAYLVEDTKF